jgi:chromosome segregation ATPase
MAKTKTPTPDAKEIVMVAQNEIDGLITELSTLRIKNTDQLQIAGERRNQVAQRIKELDAQRKEITDPLEQAKKKVIALFKEPISQLEDIKKAIDKAMLTFQSKEEEKQRKIEDEARAKAEAERQRLLEQAKKEAEAQGEDPDEVEIDEPLPEVPAPRKIESIKAFTGASVRNNYKFLVTCKAELPEEFKMADEKKIQAYANAMKEDAKLQGVRFYVEKTVVAPRS